MAFATLTPTKTVQTALLALQTVAASTVVKSSAFNMAGLFGGLVFARFGREADTAAGAGVNIRFECSFASSGDNSWVPFAIFTTQFAATTHQVNTTQANSGQATILATTTTNLTAGSLMFVFNGTIANAEWIRVKTLTASTSIVVEDNLVNTIPITTSMFNAAELFPPFPVPEGAQRIRVVADGSLFTQAFAIDAYLDTFDNVVAN